MDRARIMTLVFSNMSQFFSSLAEMQSPSPSQTIHLSGKRQRRCPLRPLIEKRSK